jgi:hypothetical protein
VKGMLPELAEKAYVVAWKRLCHDGYESDRTAVRGLMRRCPGVTPDDCEEAFRRAVELYKIAVKFVATHSRTLHTRMAKLPVPENQRSTGMIPMDDLVAQLTRKCPGFPAPVYQNAIGSIFLWDHLK